MKKNIVLIGFMASGKGQIARELFERTGMFAVDSDDLIESLSNMKIRKIFQEFGEEHFRKLERKTARWLQKNVSKSIISTGGGFVNVPNLKEIGTVVYLNSDFDYIIKSINSHPNAQKKVKKRPLLQNLDKAHELYEKRIPVYMNAADIVVNVTNRPVKDVVGDIIDQLKFKRK